MVEENLEALTAPAAPRPAFLVAGEGAAARWPARAARHTSRSSHSTVDFRRSLAPRSGRSPVFRGRAPSDPSLDPGANVSREDASAGTGARGSGLPPGSLEGPNVPLPRGLSTFDLPLGPIRIRVEDLPIPWNPFVSEHYDPFAHSPSSEIRPDLRIRCREGEGIVIPLPPKGGITEMRIERLDESRFRIRSHWQDGWVDIRSGEGDLVLTDRHYISMRMSLENFLRAASQLLLVERGAFLLHSAGILDGGRCFLLFGRSGSGKSTATELSLPRRALSDDIVLVDLTGESPVAHTVPFFGAFPPADRSSGRYEIAAAARLRQDSADRLVPLSKARAVATVSASVPFVHEFEVAHDKLTDEVARLCASVPVFDLHFTKSARFWELLAGAARD